MNTKICTKCGEEKPLTEFNFKNKAKGKRQSQCKECQRARERELYQLKYKIANCELYKNNRRKFRIETRQFIQDIKSEKGCCICGEKDPCCLDFHHIQDKEFEVSKGTDVSKERLEKEIQKCVVLCANCHRKIHAGKLSLPIGVVQDIIIGIRKRLMDD